MLQNNLELIVQYPEINGDYKCRGFKGLRIHMPAYVAFEGGSVADQATANLLGRAFCDEVSRLVGAAEESMMPCSGGSHSVSCHAMSEPTCQKILVRPAATSGVPSSSSWSAPSSDQQWQANLNDVKWTVIPVLPTGSDVATHVPTQWQGINVCFWSQHPIESIWTVMQKAGLYPDENRIFISYVRKDSSAIADQLFAELTQQGFDVFLDRCSVPIGVKFQEHLMQDICDKAMVVLLNTPGVASSHWVGEEIQVVKTYRLGLLELRFPNATVQGGLYPDFCEAVTQADLQPAGVNYAVGSEMLTPIKLANVVERIKVDHGRALHRRRYELINNFVAAMSVAGKSVQLMPDGTLYLPTSNSVVGLTTRTPELGDFSSLHQRGGISSGSPGWLVSPAPLFLANRLNQISWLSGVSNIQHANEARINALAAHL